MILGTAEVFILVYYGLVSLAFIVGLVRDLLFLVRVMRAEARIKELPLTLKIFGEIVLLLLCLIVMLIRLFEAVRLAF